MSMLQLLARPANRKLGEVVAQLPNLGVGARVARARWLPHGDSWWEVTDVKLRGDGSPERARVWGVLHWRGARADGPPRRINGSAKRVWRWLPAEGEATRLAPLAAALRAREQAARRRAAGGGGDGGSAKS